MEEGLVLVAGDILGDVHAGAFGVAHLAEDTSALASDASGHIGTESKNLAFKFLFIYKNIMSLPPEEKDGPANNKTDFKIPELPKWFASKTSLFFIVLYLIAFFWAGMFGNELKGKLAWIPDAVLAPGILIFYSMISWYYFWLIKIMKEEITKHFGSLDALKTLWSKEAWNKEDRDAAKSVVGALFLLWVWAWGSWALIKGGIYLFSKIFTHTD